MTRRLSGTTAGLALGITVAVGAASAIAAYLYSRHHFATLVGSAREAAAAQGALIHAALEHGMLENDRTLITRMVEAFGRQPHVASVMVLDKAGVARMAGGPAAPVTDLSMESPTCQACHRLPPGERDASHVFETQGGTVLRTVVPFRNHAACHGCHDPAQAVNGILLMDVDIGHVKAAMHGDLRWLVLGSGLGALVLVGLIAAVVRVGVLRRLQRFETTARLIAGGDLERRVPADGSDTISWLATEFNSMADTMSGLVGEVRRQHERLETIINSIDDGIVVLDARRRILAANAAFLRRTGHSRDHVMGCCCRDVATGMCSPGDCPTLACLKAGERQVRIFERKTADGALAWEEIHASPVHGPGGELALVVEVWRDISARRTAEARLAESHRLASLGVLASGFSHELNTPLATVLTCVEGILRGLQEGDGSHASESAAIAREQVLRCRAITQHFLRLSRGQSTNGCLLEADATVAAVARLVAPTAQAQGVQIQIAPCPAGLRVHADEADLQHALVNLLLNAVQASRPGDTVRVSVAGGDAVRIRVADSGPGIPPAQRERIFEPFYSLRQGGTGLGLFLALGFLRRWGGDIHVDGAPGEGATFEVVLPLPLSRPAASPFPDGHAQAHAPAR